MMPTACSKAFPIKASDIRRVATRLAQTILGSPKPTETDRRAQFPTIALLPAARLNDRWKQCSASIFAPEADSSNTRVAFKAEKSCWTNFPAWDFGQTQNSEIALFF